MQGKILRDTANGDGVIFVNNGQKAFSLEKHWKSGEPPVIGAVVEVTLDEQGDIESVVLVESSEIAKQKAEEMVNLIGSNGKNILSNISGVMGIGSLVCLVGLLLSASVFDFISISSSGFGYNSSRGMTLLSQLSGGKTLLFWLALIAPFSVHFIKDKKAYLSYFAPLVFFLIVVLTGTGGSTPMFRSSSGFMGASSSIDPGFGFLLFMIFSGYLGFLGFKGFRRGTLKK